jgi:hypothetical protein
LTPQFKGADSGAVMRLPRFVAGLLVVVALTPATAACTGCPTTLLVGTLAEQGQDLVAIHVGGGSPEHLAWPFGFSVQRRNGVLVVTDLFGAVKARAGDTVELGGGERGDGTWSVCGEINVGPAPT